MKKEYKDFILKKLKETKNETSLNEIKFNMFHLLDSAYIIEHISKEDFDELVSILDNFNSEVKSV